MTEATTNLNNRAAAATKWSGISEIVAKLVTPITSMVLARVLTPEAFGVVTTMAMVISFAEIFTDAGFQKYLVQHEFIDAEDREQSTTVAFWSNLSLSILLWGIIAIFNKPIAALVGSPGLGHVLIVACVSIPLAAFSSIQMALFKRNLDFKTLFKVRVASVMVPLVITLPLAFILRSYWALIFGTIANNLVNAVLLTVFSSWKPRFYYSWAKLKEMFSFTVWSLIEAITIWATGYSDIFIVSSTLSSHYLGIYRTSITTVAQITGLITAATTPVLFSSLSRLQNDDSAFNSFFFKFQKYVSLLIMPVGALIFCFSDLITAILLGNQWGEASGFIGWWGLTSAFAIAISYYCSEVYRSKGKPKLSVLSQVLFISVLLPVVLVSVKQSFSILYVSRSLVRFVAIIIDLFIMYFAFRFPIGRIFKNIFPAFISSLAIVAVSYPLLKLSDSYFWAVCVMLISIIIYFAIISLFPEEKQILLGLYHKGISSIKKIIIK